MDNSVHDGRINCIAITPDSKWAITTSSDHSMKVWNLETPGPERREEGVHPRAVTTLQGHQDVVQTVAITPDGRYAVSGSFDETLKVWDLKTFQEIRTFNDHKAKVFTVCVSPDGKYAFSAAEDKTLKIWEIETGELITTFSEGGILHHLVISPDGGCLVAGGDSRKMQILKIIGVGFNAPIVTADRGTVECAFCHDVFKIVQTDFGRSLQCPECSQPMRVNEFEIATLRKEEITVQG